MQANRLETRKLSPSERQALANLANRIAAILEAGNYQTDARSALYEALQLLDNIVAEHTPIDGDLVQRAYKASCEALDLAKLPQVPQVIRGEWS